MRISKKSVAVVAAAGIVLAGATVAFAYWTSSGSGTGSANTGTNSNFTVATTAATGLPLTPGGPTQTVAFSVTNPGTGSQNLSSVVVTVAASDGTAWSAVAGCSAADYTVGTPAFTPGQIAAGGVVNGTVTVTMKNLGSNQDGCKNATVPLYLVAS